MMRNNRTFQLIAVALFICLFATSVLAEDAKSVAIIVSAKGKAELQKKGENSWVALKFGTVLNSGDQIRTGDKSFVALVFTDDKTQLKIRPNTEITLNAERTDDYSLAKRVNMEIGELFAEVKKQKGSLQVATPTAVASVKGTKFWVTVSPSGETETLTLEGIVNLLSILTGESVDVVAGQLGAVDNEGNIDLSPIQESSLPELLDELEVQYIELNFIDEDGNPKSMIIQYRAGGDEE
jgi:hypothetical protein